jgi:uncharacterized protein
MRVFITGASAGIGRLTAERLCTRGHEVWGTARDISRLPQIDNFHPVQLDLNDLSSVEHGYKGSLKDAVHFDVVINNAGAGTFGPLEAFDDQEFMAQLQTLLIGPLRLIRLALPDMRFRRQGLIINVSSLAGEFPLPFMAPYSMSKSALSAMSEGLALELAHTGVRVVDVRPGDFATNFHESTRRIGGEIASDYEPNLTLAWNGIDKNMNRAGSPSAVAKLLSDLVEGKRTGPIARVGQFFQAVVAPYLTRFSRRSWVQWSIQIYYGLKRGS